LAVFPSLNLFGAFIELFGDIARRHVRAITRQFEQFWLNATDWFCSGGHRDDLSVSLCAHYHRVRGGKQSFTLAR
jgi:hypothetical protein